MALQLAVDHPPSQLQFQFHVQSLAVVSVQETVHSEHRFELGCETNVCQLDEPHTQLVKVATLAGSHGVVATVSGAHGQKAFFHITISSIYHTNGCLLFAVLCQISKYIGEE